ncbi:MAG: hypothetical protein ABL925_04835 [Methylococcales bacterium]
MSSFYGKAVVGSILLAIVIAVLVPDLLVGLIFEIGHLLFELVHIVFEFIEEALDIIIEHLLGTGLHNTQIIVFYILFSIFSYFCYRLILKVPNQYRKVKHGINTAYTDFKTESMLYWHNLALIKKIQWLVIGVSSLVIMFLFGF